MLGAQKFLDAVKSGDAARLKQMLVIDPELANARTESGTSAVMTAIYHSRTDVLHLLLERGARLDIHEAAAAGKSEHIAALAAQSPGAVNSYSADGFTPLALAAFFGHRDAAQWLLANGAEVNAVAKNPTGYTPLTGAVARGDTEIVHLLLSNGANAAHRYGAGYSALHEAAVGGRLEIAKLLLDHGADSNARTDDGQTPLSMADAKGQTEAAALLRQRGATS
ncbi:MAG TPA: ankyrin repeat domain-containing protein [Candidatus Acidoferrales bacterium]|nr:ankyrin repeat domain-containing protein [Candidatus Acidoferrales bacterium]